MANDPTRWIRTFFQTRVAKSDSGGVLVVATELPAAMWGLAVMTDSERQLGWTHLEPTFDEECLGVRFCPEAIVTGLPEAVTTVPNRSLQVALEQAAIILDVELAHVELPLPADQLARLDRFWAERLLSVVGLPVAPEMAFRPSP